MFKTHNNIPKRKLGVEIPSVESMTIRADNILLFETAATIPRTIPIKNAKHKEVNNNPTLLNNVSKTRRRAGVSVLCQ